MKHLLADTRAQSIGLSRFVLTLGVGAIMVFILNEVALKRVLPGARQATSNTTANQGTKWLEQGIGLVPETILVISLFGVIALAVYQRERLR